MKYRPRLNDVEYELIKKHRALQKECELTGIPMKDVDHYWHKGKHFSLHVKNKGVSPEELRDDIIAAMDKHSPSYKKIKRKKNIREMMRMKKKIQNSKKRTSFLNLTMTILQLKFHLKSSKISIMTITLRTKKSQLSESIHSIYYQLINYALLF